MREVIYSDSGGGKTTKLAEIVRQTTNAILVVEDESKRHQVTLQCDLPRNKVISYENLMRGSSRLVNPKSRIYIDDIEKFVAFTLGEMKIEGISVTKQGAGTLWSKGLLPRREEVAREESGFPGNRPRFVYDEFYPTETATEQEPELRAYRNERMAEAVPSSLGSSESDAGYGNPVPSDDGARVGTATNNRAARRNVRLEHVDMNGRPEPDAVRTARDTGIGYGGSSFYYVMVTHNNSVYVVKARASQLIELYNERNRPENYYRAAWRLILDTPLVDMTGWAFSRVRDINRELYAHNQSIDGDSGPFVTMCEELNSRVMNTFGTRQA